MLINDSNQEIDEEIPINYKVILPNLLTNVDKF